MIRYFILFFVPAFLICFKHAKGQDYHFYYDGFLDNREYFNPHISPQTMFGNRVSLEIGFPLDSANAFYGGLSYLYEFGSKGDLISPDVTLYYKHQKDPFIFYFGAFPRRDLIRHPRVLLTDTLQFYRPNVEGTFVQFQGDWGYQHVWIDWLSRQTLNKEEVFLVGYSGCFKIKPFFLKTHAILHHIAGTANLEEDHNLRDNGGFMAQAGVDLSGQLFFDRFTFSVGPVFSYDRLRGVYPLEYHQGIIANARIGYKGYGVDYTFYKGDGQVQAIGDAFYTANRYMRFDTYLTPFQNDHASIRLTFGFHFVPGYVDFSQQLRINFNLNNEVLPIFK